MPIHPIHLTLENGAKDCRLKLLEGLGTWGRFSDNNFLSLELDDPQIVVNVLESHPFPDKGTTEVRVAMPGTESLSAIVSQTDIVLRMAPNWLGDRAYFTLYFNAQGSNTIFDAILSRTDTAGMVTVYSPDGDETDYLLPGLAKRRVTLPLMPPPGP